MTHTVISSYQLHDITNHQLTDSRQGGAGESSSTAPFVLFASGTQGTSKYGTKFVAG